MDNGHWNFTHQMDDKSYFGFIYLIVNKTNGHAYIGRKQYRKAGKKRSKTYGHQNAWRNYKSSCKRLLADIKEFGKESFDFYCLMECEDRTDLYYWEVKLIMQYDALIHNNFYNDHAPDIYVLPKCLGIRKRKELIPTLIQRSISCERKKRFRSS